MDTCRQQCGLYVCSLPKGHWTWKKDEVHEDMITPFSEQWHEAHDREGKIVARWNDDELREVHEVDLVTKHPGQWAKGTL